MLLPKVGKYPSGYISLRAATNSVGPASNATGPPLFPFPAEESNILKASSSHPTTCLTRLYSLPITSINTYCVANILRHWLAVAVCNVWTVPLKRILHCRSPPSEFSSKNRPTKTDLTRARPNAARLDYLLACGHTPKPAMRDRGQ